MRVWPLIAWLMAALVGPLAVAQSTPLSADCPQFARYRNDNAAVKSPRAGDARVVFLGDSITGDWGRKVGEFFPGKPYLNRGISGETTRLMLARFCADVIALQPRAVVILAGTNDLPAGRTLAEIERDLNSMAELACANGIRVVLASVLPVHDYESQISASRPHAQIVALNAWIKGYAQRQR